MPHNIIFSQQTIKDYNLSLGSSAATPGGGAAAALTAAQGVNLVSMVCSLTVGKEKYAEYNDLNQEILDKCSELQAICLDRMDKDAIAFYDMIAVYKMSKSTPEEQEAYLVAKENALKTCTLPPLELMDISVKGLSYIDAVLGKSNSNAVSDLGAAASCFQSVLECSWLNVVINLRDIQDQTFATEKRTAGETLLLTGKAKARELYDKVLTQLT